jgi:hypothetical protein
VAGDLLLIAGQGESLRIDLTQAADRASAIVGGIESSLRMRRGLGSGWLPAPCSLWARVGAALGR